MSAADARVTTLYRNEDERLAFAWCRRYARAREENFTVVSWFLPSALRPHFFSLYAFCRSTDDLGDEAGGDRLALLDDWEGELLAAYEGRRTQPLFIALGRTIDRFAIPSEPFLRLIEANRMDQRRSTFASYEQLRDYCDYSATPVGRMVLYTLGYRDEERQRLADATCIGLQLANFWQDVSVDLEKGRVYLPLDDLRTFGYGEEELRAGIVNAAFRSLLRFEVERTRALFRQGRGLERLVDRGARLDVMLFRLAGEAVLDAIEAAGYDVLHGRPRVSRWTKARMMLVQGARLKFAR